MRAQSTAMATQKIKALQGVIRTQRAVLRRWIALFGNYCTTADSGQLYKDTMEVV